MKSKLEKDLRYRKNFNKKEVLTLPSKAILKNERIDIKLRNNFFIKNILIKDKRYQIHNRCIISGRSRSFIRFFSLSRIKFRELALKGLLFGIKKSSW
jgi:small subunit ribosomal protein S14